MIFGLLSPTKPPNWGRHIALFNMPGLNTGCINHCKPFHLFSQPRTMSEKNSESDYIYITYIVVVFSSQQ